MTMEKSIVAAVEQPYASFIRIDSIYIDIRCPVEEENSIIPDHFSIRGFVSEMRKRNLKMCSPFHSEGDDDDDDDSNRLPSLSVPKFRRWQCSHCMIPADTTEGIASLQIVPVNPSNTNGSLGSSGVCFPKRKRKLRSLADIMKEKEDNNNSATPSSSSSFSHGATTESEFEIHPASSSPPPRRKKKTTRAGKRIKTEKKVSRNRRQAGDYDDDHMNATEKTVSSNGQQEKDEACCLHTCSDSKTTQEQQQQQQQQQQPPSPAARTGIPDLNEAVPWNQDIWEENGGDENRDVEDDIPMKIVELLAKNLQERSAQKSRRSYYASFLEWQPLNGFSSSSSSSVQCRSMGNDGLRKPPLKLLSFKNAAAPFSGGEMAAEICVVNRNPADFSVPEAGNVFTTDFKARRGRISRKPFTKNTYISVVEKYAIS